jgi:hypothetical protein
MQATEEMYGGRDIRLVLIDLYNTLGSQAAVARRLGLTQSTIHAWFRRLNIHTNRRAL